MSRPAFRFRCPTGSACQCPCPVMHMACIMRICVPSCHRATCFSFALSRKQVHRNRVTWAACRILANIQCSFHRPLQASQTKLLANSHPTNGQVLSGNASNPGSMLEYLESQSVSFPMATSRVLPQLPGWRVFHGRLSGINQLVRRKPAGNESSSFPRRLH